MSDVAAGSSPDLPNTEIDELRTRAEVLEHQLVNLQKDTEARLLRASLRTAALQAGMIDLDGLRLLDLSAAALDPDGEIADGAALMASFRRQKPWLFSNGSSSSTADFPPAPPPRVKLATEMTNEEYRAARAAILKRRS